MKLLITGDREWNDYQSVIDALLDVLKEFEIDPSKITIIHGAARGADCMAAEVAERIGMVVKPYPAHWRHTEQCPKSCKEMVGRPAGVIRNQKMLNENPDIDLALFFHHDLTNSKGTRDMVNRLKKAGIPTRDASNGLKVE
jgi:hypothetical protein